MATIDDVKSIIKGLLISTQKQLSLFDLCREFQLQENNPIPFQRLGYNRLTDFLQSIPDTLQLSKGSYHGNPCFFVQPVVTNATQHMENFVQEQNRKNTRHRGGLIRRPRAVSSHGSRRNRSSPPLCRRTRSPDNRLHRGTSHHHEPRRSERAQSTVHSRLGPIPNRRVTPPTDHRSVLAREEPQRSRNTDPTSRLGPMHNQDQGFRPPTNDRSAACVNKRPQEAQNADFRSRLGPILNLNNNGFSRVEDRSGTAPCTQNTDSRMMFGPILNTNHQTENGPHTVAKDPRSHHVPRANVMTKDVQMDCTAPASQPKKTSFEEHSNKNVQMRDSAQFQGIPRNVNTTANMPKDSQMHCTIPASQPKMMSYEEYRTKNLSRDASQMAQFQHNSVPATKNLARETQMDGSAPPSPPKKSRFEEYRNKNLPKETQMAPHTSRTVTATKNMPKETQIVPPSPPKKIISLEQYRTKKIHKTADTVAPAAASSPVQVGNRDSHRHNAPEATASFGHVSLAIPKLSSDLAKVHIAPPRTNVAESCPTDTTPRGKVPARVLKLLVQLLDLYPEQGIPIIQLNDKYKSYHKEALSYYDYGFLTVMDMINSIKEHVVIVETPNDQHTLIFSAQEYFRNSTQSVGNNSSNQVVDGGKEKDCSVNDAKHLPLRRPKQQPRNTVVLGEQLPALEWPEGATDLGSEVRINMEHVVSPSEFFFSFPGPNNSDRLQQLMHEMNERFTRSNENWRVRTLHQGLYVVAYRMVDGRNTYHRARIIQVYDKNSCQVRYIDKGEVHDEFRESLQYLLSEYAELPQQAVRGCMHDLEPSSGKWSLIEQDYFARMLRQPMLLATLRRVTSVCVELELHTKVDSTWFNIGEQMVSLRMAVSSSRVQAAALPDRHPISSVDMQPMEVTEQRQIPSFEEERPKPFLDCDMDFLRTMLLSDNPMTAQPANVAPTSSPVHQAEPAGWYPTGTGSYTCLPALLVQKSAVHSEDDKHSIMEKMKYVPPCYDLSSDSEVEVLDQANVQVANKQRVYIVKEMWGTTCMHVVNHKNRQFLLLDEVAVKLLHCSSGFALLTRTSPLVKLDCETVHQNELRNLFREIFNFRLDHFVMDQQIHLLAISSLLLLLPSVPEFYRVYPRVLESINNFRPDDPCWYA